MSVKLPHLFCLGVSHNSAPAQIRETLFIPHEQLGASLQATKAHYGLAELAALSTCNRFELYGVSHTPMTDAEIIECYHHLQNTGKSKTITTQTIQKYHYAYRDQEAVRHLFTVAASLDSMVVGETQITGQFKDAMQMAQDVKTIGSYLTRLSQEALATSKKIRSNTEIGRRSVSVCHSAIDLARRVYADLTQYCVTVVGAGNMARIACEHLKHLGAHQVLIVNRTFEKAQTLAKHVGATSAHALEELPSILRRSDIVLVATQAEDFVINSEILKSSQREKSMVLLDVSIPRNIDPQCNDLDHIYLFDIDDIQQSIAQNLDERKKAVDDALHYIDQGVTHYMRWLNQSFMGPMLNLYKENLRDLAHYQLQKTLAKSDFAQMDAKQKELLEGTSRMIADAWIGKIAQIFKGMSQDHSSALDSDFNSKFTKVFYDFFSQENKDGHDA